jgi:hypothetical protein
LFSGANGSREYRLDDGNSVFWRPAAGELAQNPFTRPPGHDNGKIMVTALASKALSVAAGSKAPVRIAGPPDPIVKVKLQGSIVWVLTAQQLFYFRVP